MTDRYEALRAAPSLESQIMNLPCKVPAAYAPGKADEAVYKIAHRDARHAAAELVLKADATIRELLAEREALLKVRALLWDEHPECCGSPVVGAEYMGDREMVCCGCPEPALLSDAQIVATLRSMLPADAAIQQGEQA